MTARTVRAEAPLRAVVEPLHEAPEILPRPRSTTRHHPAGAPALTVHRTGRVTRCDSGVASLAADPTLRSAWELLSPRVATETLRQRMHAARRETLEVRRVHLQEHVAGRHCLLRFSVVSRGLSRTWHGTIHAEDRSLRQWLTRRRLWNAGLRCLAQPIGVVPERHLYLERQVEGVALPIAMLTHASTNSLADATLRALRSLADLPLLPTRSWSASDVSSLLPGIAAAGASLPAARRALEEQLRALIAPLRLRTEAGVILPGADANRLILADGRVCLHAIEDIALGDPAHDLGALVGTLVLHGHRFRHERAAAWALASALLSRAERREPERWHRSAVSRYAVVTVARRLPGELLHDMMEAVERDGTIASILP